MGCGVPRWSEGPKPPKLAFLVSKFVARGFKGRLKKTKKTSRLETPAPTLEVPGAPPLRTPGDKFL